MATAPSISPFFTAPYRFPYPIPTQIDQNWPPAAPTQIHGDLYHTYPLPLFPGGYPSPFPYSTYHQPFPFAPSAFGAAASGSFPYSQAHSTNVPPAPPIPPATALMRHSDQVPGAPTSPVIPTEPQTALPTLPASRAISAGAPDGHTVSELQTSEVPRTAKNKGNASQRVPLDSIYQGDVLSKGNCAGGDYISDEQLVHEHGPGIVQAVREERVSAKVATLHQQQYAFQRHATGLLLNRAPSGSTTATRDSTAALSRPPRDCLQANVFDRITEVTTTASVSVGSGYYGSSTSTAPTPFLGFTSSAGSAATRTATVPSQSATEFSAPKVLGEMPTPKFCPRKFSSLLHYYQEQENPIRSTGLPEGNRNPSEQNLDEKPIQNSCVQSVSTSPGCQNLDEMPQRYGLQSLSRQSIVLSDDSEHSYYALPEKYNLDQAASQPVFDVYADERDGSSTDLVDVLASLQEQHTYEDQQTYGSIEYSHSNNEIELSSVTNSELCSELGKAQVHNHEWNMLLTEKREEWDPGIRKTLMGISQVAKLSSFPLVSSPLSMLWDPGASLPLISIKARQLDQTLQTSIHASTLVDKLQGQENVAPLAGSSVTGFSGYKCSSFWIQHFFALWKLEIGMATYISWDPGIAFSWFMSVWSEMRATCLQSPLFNAWHYQLQMSKHSVWDPGILCIRYRRLVKYTVSPPVTAAAVLCSKGKHSLFFANGDNCRTHHYLPKLFMHSLCTTQVVQVPTQRHTLEYRLLEVMSQNGSEFRTGQLTCMPQSPMFNSSELLQQKVNVLSSWLHSFDNRAKLHWDPGITASLYMHIWLETRAVQTFTWLQNPLLNDLQCQLPMCNSSSAWDPGIELLFVHQPSINENFKTKCLLLSSKYLQIWDIGTFFTTFLPP